MGQRTTACSKAGQNSSHAKHSSVSQNWLQLKHFTARSRTADLGAELAPRPVFLGVTGFAKRTFLYQIYGRVKEKS